MPLIKPNTMNDFVIYHNPRCSKSRETLALLEEAGITPRIVKYLDSPLDGEELIDLAKLLDLKPIEFTRTKEADFRALGIKPEHIHDEQVIELMASNPKLIERPIVVKDGLRAVIGRPPENVKSLLN
jgi:arsenate reductase (glutaredoxin)